MAAIGPVEPCTVHEETIVIESCGKRCFSSVPVPPTIEVGQRGNLRYQHAFVGLYVCPTSLCSPIDEIFDHLFVLHRFCDFPVPAIRLIRRKRLSLTTSLVWNSFVARAGRTSDRSQAELMTMLRGKLLSLRKIGIALFGLGVLNEF